MEEKEKFQISDGYNGKDMAIDWEKLPSEISDTISGDYFYNILFYDRISGIETKTVVFFRKVSKFRKGISVFDYKGIELGVE